MKSIVRATRKDSCGFTGHEHIDEFGIINMNGRVYCPLTAQFFSPDPHIQAPGNWLNYNRYSYVWNNPLRYTDPSGEIIHLVIGAAIGGAINLFANRNNINNFWQGLGYFGIGAAAGALGAGVGAGISSALAGGGFGAGFIGSPAAMTATSSFVRGTAIGGGAGFSSGFTTGFGNALLGGQNFGQALDSGLKGAVIGSLSGAAMGGLFSGINAMRDGRRFWDGATVERNILVQHDIPIVGQIGTNDCLPASVQAVDASFGGGITQQDVRGWPGLGGYEPLVDTEVWLAYSNASGHEVFGDLNIATSLPRVVSTMQDGGRVAINLNTGNPVGHSVVMHSVVQRTVTTISGNVRQKLLYYVMNPGHGGSIQRIPIRSIIGAHNIFYIW